MSSVGTKGQGVFAPPMLKVTVNGRAMKLEFWTLWVW